MSPSPQGYRQPWEEPSPEREVFDEMLRRPYEELHAENERLCGSIVRLANERHRLHAENQRLREALVGLDAPIAWIAENYPAALTAMPTPLYRRIAEAGQALA